MVPRLNSAVSQKPATAILKVLIEAARAYSHPARQNRLLLSRLEGLPQDVKEIAWKVPLRLCAMVQETPARKNRNSVVTATCRKLAGFMWAIACAMLPAWETLTLDVHRYHGRAFHMSEFGAVHDVVARNT